MFNASQKRGIWLLLLLLMLAAGGRVLWKRLGAKGPTLLWPASEQAPQPLQINRADSAQWVALPGIGPALTRRILNYRQAKGGFHSVEEIAQVYGLPPETFERIRPWLLADSAYLGPGPATGSRAALHLDLNRADSAALTALPGIGPVLAGRIVKYRRAAGGFRSVEQLSKIYGLSPETYERIRPLLYLSAVDAEPVQTTQTPAPGTPLDLNRADSAALTALPGIGPVLAGRIVKYRRAAGGFRSVEQLSKIYGLSPESYERIRPLIYVSATPEAAAPRMSKAAAPSAPLDLNRADSAALTTLPGIGPVLAGRIVSYRRAVGFFVKPEQLRRVYGLSEENYQRMLPHLNIGSLPAAAKKNLNRTSSKELARYVDAATAKRIVNYRDANGPFPDWPTFEKKLQDIEAGERELLRAYFDMK